jgi:hypothetical protein
VYPRGVFPVAAGRDHKEVILPDEMMKRMAANAGK